MLAAILGVTVVGLLVYVLRLRAHRSEANKVLVEMGNRLLEEWLYAEMLRVDLLKYTEDELTPRERTVVLKPGMLGDGEDIRA